MLQEMMLINIIDEDNEYCLESLPPEKLLIDYNVTNFSLYIKSKNDFSRIKNKQYQWFILDITNDPYTKSDGIFTNLGYSAIKIQIPDCYINYNEDKQVLEIKTDNFSKGCVKLVTPLRRVVSFDWDEKKELQKNIGFMLQTNAPQVCLINYKEIGQRFDFMYGINNILYHKTMNMFSFFYPCEILSKKKFKDMTAVYHFCKQEFN
jgi:hypothetical protein